MRWVLMALVAGCTSQPLGAGGDGSAGGSDGATPPDLVAGGAVGDACSTGTDCATGQCITPDASKLYFGGYCTVFDCDQKQQPCPTGSACKPGGDGRYYCLKDCDPMLNKQQCRTGYACCSGPGPTGNMGWCAPTDSSLCLAG